jgi:hypothetical protein
MLIQFSVGNYRSFKERTVFSMVAANTKSKDPLINKNNVFHEENNLELLTSTAIYGANSSGKSNLVKALAFMRQFVLTSASTPIDSLIPVEPFQLSTETENEPSFFEIIFCIEHGIQYRYGFEVNNKKVISEWLFAIPKTKEARYFTREESAIDPSSKYFKEGKGLIEKTRPNALFLAVAAQFNGETSLSIVNWFQQIAIVSGLDDTFYRGYTINQVSTGQYRNAIIKLVKDLDLDIENIEVNKLEKDRFRLPPGITEVIQPLLIKNIEDNGLFTINTIHQKLDQKGKSVGSIKFDMGNNESEGTQKAFFLAGPIISVLSLGNVLIIDEMEARLHPILTRNLIQLFNSIETNPKHAQLIFTTHDTNLLSNKIFRRDQIWFIEKDKFCASHLYSLAEIKIDDNKVRNDASFEDDYLKGRYGAIPFLGGIKKVVLEEGQNIVEK